MAKDVIAHYATVSPAAIQGILAQGGSGEFVQTSPWPQAIEYLAVAKRWHKRFPLLLRCQGASEGVEWWAYIDAITRRGAKTAVSVSSLQRLAQAIPLEELAPTDRGSTAGVRRSGNESCLVSGHALGAESERTALPARSSSAKADALRAAAVAEIDADPSSRAEGPTTRERLVDARLGQGGYRTRLLKLWGGKCALTGCSVAELLVASHAKKWSLSTNDERLDRFNGLVLSASADKLFEAGLIAFASNGKLLVKPSVSLADLETQGLRRGMKLRRVDDRHLPYLEAHRRLHGFD